MWTVGRSLHPRLPPSRRQYSFLAFTNETFKGLVVSFVENVRDARGDEPQTCVNDSIRVVRCCVPFLVAVSSRYAGATGTHPKK